MIDPKALEAVFRSLADLKQDRRAEEAMTYERSRGPELIPEGADMSQYSQVSSVDTPKQVQQIGDLEEGLSSLSRAIPRTNLGTVSTEGMLSDEQKKLIGKKEKSVPDIPTGGQEKKKFEPTPGQMIPDFSSREPVVTEKPKTELQRRRDTLESVMLDESGQNLIETVDMFKQYPKPFENRDIGKIYVSNVLNSVSSYIPDKFDKNKLKSLLMYTAGEESDFGSNVETFKKRDIEGGTVGHGGIQQVTTRGFRNNLIFKPGPTAKKMIEQLKKDKGIDIKSFMKTSKGTDLESRIAINDFLRTPFGSNFAASIFYINALENPGGSGKAARDLYNSDKYNEKDFRDIFYKGSKTYGEVSNILKDDKIKESKTGGMIEKDPYKRQPRFI